MKNTTPASRWRQRVILALIYLILFAVTVYVPVVGMLALIVLPLPFIFQTLRHDLSEAILLAGVCIVLSLLVAPIPTVLLTVISSSVGLVMGYYYRTGTAPFIPIMAGLITYLANYVAIFLLGFLLLDLNILNFFNEVIREGIVLTQSESLLTDSVEGGRLMEEAAEMITLLLPGWFILSSLAMSFLHHLAVSKGLSRFGVDIRPLPPFRQWDLPRAVLFYYLVVLLILLLQLVDKQSALYMPVLNIHFVLELLLLLQGLSLTAHLFYVKGVNRLLLIPLVGLSIIPLFGSLFRIAGIIDLGFNIKERLNHSLRS